MTSKVVRTNNKSSTAATTTSEDIKNQSPAALPPSPEDGARKHPPEELIEVEKPKQKVTTLWSRGKLKKVVVVNLPKGNNTGSPSNENGISFCSQCNEKCASSLSTPCKKCCETETHISEKSW